MMAHTFINDYLWKQTGEIVNLGSYARAGKSVIIRDELLHAQTFSYLVHGSPYINFPREPEREKTQYPTMRIKTGLTLFDKTGGTN